jgi:hypothetical protein
VSGLRYFCDNTVLWDYAAVDRLDLLRSVLSERGRWTEAIAYEVGRFARYLPALAALIQDGWLGEPIEIIEQAATVSRRARTLAKCDFQR